MGQRSQNGRTRKRAEAPNSFNLNSLDNSFDRSLSKKVIIGIDFGTTYSSVSYVEVKEGQRPEQVDLNSIHAIGNFPESFTATSDDSMINEVPTEVIYSLNNLSEDDQALDATVEYAQNEPSSSRPGRDTVHNYDHNLDMSGSSAADFFWGYQAHEYLASSTTHSDASQIPLSRFKLMLMENDERTEGIRAELTATLEDPGVRRAVRDYQNVIADFLTALLTHTQSELHEKGFDSSYRREIVLCVPSIWSQKACRVMQTCMAFAMKRADFQGVGLENESIENLFLVSEPEAAAAYTLSTIRDLQCGEIFILLDAGGGTVDANTYRVSNTVPLRLSEEIADPQGGLFGSSYVNEGLRTLLKKKLSTETYLENGIETIDGIVDSIIVRDFEYRIKRGYDYYKSTFPRQFNVPGLRDDPDKGFQRGAIWVQACEIKEQFAVCFNGIIHIMEQQIREAVQRAAGNKITKVVLIGGFAASKSLRKTLERRLNEINRENKCEINLVCPGRNCPNAVAMGAVLRALDKDKGPRRRARSSYGIVRSEYFGEWPQHKGEEPYYDPHDGLPYVWETIDWKLKLGRTVPSSWQCEPFECIHTIDYDEPKLICREVLYVSDRSTESHYKLSHPKNKGAQMVGEIEADFSFLRDEGLIDPIKPTNSHGKGLRVPYYKIVFKMVIKVVDRDLTCYLIYDNKVLKKCRINIACGFQPGVK